MIIARTISDMRAAVNTLKQQQIAAGIVPSVGFVPTMGYLHEGHASLMRAAKDCSISVLSIFVNPIQFGPNEDLDRYPRDEARDLQLAEQCGVDVVFLPTVDIMYPSARKTTIQVTDVSARLCGASRPGHFDGVTTVVAKLFNIVKPDRAYFGMKDAQQVAVIQQMVDDLNFDLTIVPCPIVREQDGLALSSRNVYLCAEEREQALVLSQALQSIDALLEQHPSLTAADLVTVLQETITTKPLAKIDYVEVLQFPSLQPQLTNEPLVQSQTQVIVALAVHFGRTRLIDNRLLFA
ncbi:pantoate--beta-alanine ligase [Paenibacillus sp. 481]|uniref:pantoate--beta-alanine ligase n=1 Tax=Paenibacillus sp. 481 TaxID=2835869 RepID=UPI001E4C3C37|nr:pantoate--beta-alanine ligase [Paenibacillus sp. 481]UHA72994.1 pantoate--beta-alanine ligase [Paenibacillus sp. 481]